MLEDTNANSSPSQNNESDQSCSSLLRRAAQACSAGDEELGLHLYLAAYEKGASSEGPLDSDAAFALRKAWMIAVKNKERSLAEHIFERMEPLLEPHELAICTSQLQSLALEKLEQLGLSREDLQEMTSMISQDFMGLAAPGVMKVEHVALPSGRNATITHETVKLPLRNDGEGEIPSGKSQDGQTVASSHGEVDSESFGDGEFVNERVDAVGSADVEPAPPMLTDDSLPSSKEEPSRGDDAGSAPKPLVASDASGAADADPDAHAILPSLETLTFADISGYAHATRTMRDFGIGMQGDAQFQELVDMLNQRHGLDRMPAADSFLFRAPAREDAHRFMVATLGELGLPAIRMHMEENLQGAPVLCVMAQADNHPRLNSARNAFEGPGVLMLEDLDLWEAPAVSQDDEFGAFLYASLSRGAREAMSLIRSAVENPDVYVLASASNAGGIDGFFYDLLEPISVVDIDNPDEEERRDIWVRLMSDHPSLRGNDLTSLVQLTRGMPRFDMYMACREAIEEAYKASLMRRSYVPVTCENLFEKLAAYQPLDSNEYRLLEDAVVHEFGRGLDDNVDDLLER